MRLRVLGLGWKDLATVWSQNGEEYTVNQLSVDLKKLFSHQRTREIPNKPPVKLPEKSYTCIREEKAAPPHIEKICKPE